MGVQTAGIRCKNGENSCVQLTKQIKEQGNAFVNLHFVLIPFPTTAKDHHARAIWKKNVNRSSGNRNWEPD